jgi:nicotinate-nucleotide adenylyltransferase
LFGGTFDPVHLGHLRASLEVREAFNLDRVYLIPSATPPHKAPGRVSDPGARIEMLRAAVAGDPGFVVSQAEFKRKGPSYTIDTVREFQADFPEDHRLHWIIGLDAFLEIDTWKSYPDLLSRVGFLVMLRPGVAEQAGTDALSGVRRFVSERISDRYTFSAQEARFVHPHRPAIQLTKVTAMGISSTSIRSLVRAGKSIRYLVPEAVERIILNKGLYL